MKKVMKRDISVLLTVLMLLSSWVFAYIGTNQDVDAVADDGTPLTLEPLETIEIGDMENSITFEVKEFSGIAAVRGVEQLLGDGSPVYNVAVDTSDFLEINLFNYTNLRNTVANKGNTYLNDNSVHQGINLSDPSNWNSLRDFRFYSYGIKKLHDQPYSINNYTCSTN